MSTLDTPKFAPAHSDFPHYITNGGLDLASNPNLYTPEYEELLSSLYWEIKRAGYPDTLETMGMVQYVITAPTKDKFGNDIFACVNYDSHGHLCTMGGHSAPVGDAGEGHTIIWSCYMD